MSTRISALVGIIGNEALTDDNIFQLFVFVNFRQIVTIFGLLGLQEEIGLQKVMEKSGNLVVTNVILYFALYFILRGALCLQFFV